MRHFVWTLLVLAVMAPVVLWYLNSTRTPVIKNEGATLALTNRPATFCPNTARVVAAKTSSIPAVHFEGEAVIADCYSVKLPTEQLTEAVEYQLFVYIPGARAFRVVVPGPINTAINAPIQLGDVNSDNVINEIDARGVESALGQSTIQSEFDVDGDGKVTVLDYSLVQVNQGAGVERPDGKLWEAI